MTDHDLLRAWRTGDAAAGQQLINRHLEAILRFFSNKVPGAADDLVQKTFLACVEGVEVFEERASFRSYLFAIARNVLHRHYRDEHQAFDPLAVSVSALAADQRTPAERVTEKEEKRLLLHALRSLPLELQTLVELAYWEGLSDRELAEVVDVPAGTIKSRLRKARTQLESQMSTLASSPALLQSTRQTLDAWAAGIRDETGIEGDGHRR